MDALLGTMPDAAVAMLAECREESARYRRRKLGRSPYRSTLGPVMVQCGNCGARIHRKPRDLRRSARLFCNTDCAAAAQKTRDAEMLRYGPGWRAIRRAVRERDKVCRACGTTPEQNGAALHVHHLRPLKVGGTNAMENLVAMCASCHHTAEAATDRALRSIPLAISLDGSCLTITLASDELWRGSVRGVPFPMKDRSAT